MKTSLRNRLLAGTFAVGTLAFGGLFPQRAYAPVNGEITILPTVKLEAIAPVNSEIKKVQKLVAEDFKNRGRIESEQLKNYNSDPIYKTVVEVYNSVKGPFNLSRYLTPEFFRADIFVESTDNLHAVSPAGARGYTQMTPAAAADVGVKDFNKAVVNSWDSINMSMAYFSYIDRSLFLFYPGWDKLSNLEKLENIAYAYNAGYGALLSRGFGNNAKFDVKNLPKETQNYWPKILRAWAKEFPETFAYDLKRLNYPFNADSSKIIDTYLMPEVGSGDLIASK